MKRVIPVLLALLLLSGCVFAGENSGGVSFYYPRAETSVGIADGSPAEEIRNVAGYDMEYVLRLYLLGPLDENLTAVYPADIQLQSAELSGKTLTVTLTPVGNRLTDISFSLANACLAQTCFGLLDVQTVCVRSGDRQMSLNRNQLVFRDARANLDTLPE